MSAVYNFVWDASTPGNLDWGVREYQVVWTDNGNQGSATTGDTFVNEVVLNEGAAIHLEVRAVGQNGLVSEPAVIDFTAAAQPQPGAPSVPGNLRADFVRFQ